MASEPNKTSNKLRIAVCILYITQIFFLTETYSYPWDTQFKQLDLKNGMSDFYMIYNSIDAGQFEYAAYSIILALIPIAGFFVFAFDRNRNVKNIYGVLSSVIAVFLILATIGSALGLGATMALILYIPIVFLSVMGMFSKMLVTDNTRK